MDTKFCQVCAAPIPFNPSKGIKVYSQRKYCSTACAYKAMPQQQSKTHPERMKACEVCGNIIPKERNRNWNQYALKRYCSRACSAIAKSQKITAICVGCGKTIERSPSHIRGEIYCSAECRRNSREYTCDSCGKTFVRRPSERQGAHVYCSTKCQGVAKRKNNGQTQGRRSPEDLAWKAIVLQRDNHTCQMCGSQKRLEVHHVIPIRDRPDLRHEITNGQTLCHQCHYYGVHEGKPNLIHGRYSKPRL